MANRAERRRAKALGLEEPERHTVGDVLAWPTDSGCTIAMTDGEMGAEVDLTPDKALDVAASIVVAAMPSALKQGVSLDDYMGMLAARLTAKADDAARQANAVPS